MIFQLFKKGNPIKNGIWMLLISVLMMGFSTINNFEIFGVVKIDLNQKIKNLTELNKALQDCPENGTVKKMIKQQINEINTSDKTLNSKQSVIVSEAYLATGKTEKALKKSQEALQKDEFNKKAMAILRVIELSNRIENIQYDRDALILKNYIDTLTSNNTISPSQKKILNTKLSKKIRTMQKFKLIN